MKHHFEIISKIFEIKSYKIITLNGYHFNVDIFDLKNDLLCQDACVGSPENWVARRRSGQRNWQRAEQHAKIQSLSTGLFCYLEGNEVDGGCGG